MENVYFKPWVGSQYGTGKDRILLLGESHYADRKPSPSFTIDLTQEYIDGELRHRYWTQIMQVVSGKRHWDIDKHSFWHEVAFYNFIQDVVGDSAGKPPTSQLIENSVVPFFEVLSELKPTHLLVLSKRLWGYLPSDGKQGSDLVIENDKRETRIYNIPGGEVKATWLPHPSYFSAPKWHPWVVAFLKQ
ncbi:hypothetical protein SAMN02745216_02988 [Desulfatibacillum alkenivorans DSM 16219]|jgi:hypothetical protein|uniref:Uracil DNA glycosylase superfamily protein n=1 Tax=Desulfatibacillum alkenivorans DSM 16219 TaxID=1121393 RepID=A0A1M6Q7V0_9BACT|nr:hypothetical protein [Desulfatibacillum alkenivorans]SHK16271.1 hypothetical protein SAMN02745216_02988 [Desulfatibacillum alkenivorans DSM 16219]